jgi:hypothetical protein
LTVVCGLLATSLALGAPSAHGDAASQKPTLAQVLNFVQQATAAKKAPSLSSMIPSLTIASTSTPNAMIPSACYATTTPQVVTTSNDTATTCAFGTLNANLSHTALVIGDSQAAMWIPAFQAFGLSSGWKFIFLGKVGCGPWLPPSGKGIASCTDSVKNMIAFANTLKPRYVIPTGLTLGWGGSLYPTQTQFQNELVATINALSPSGAKILYFTEIPQFYSTISTSTPTSCLTLGATDITKCELTKTQLASLMTTKGLTAVSVAKKIPMVPTTKLFCGTIRCALYLPSSDGNHLIYSDGFHINAQFSAWISVAFGQVLAPYLT